MGLYVYLIRGSVFRVKHGEVEVQIEDNVHRHADYLMDLFEMANLLIWRT